jgi:hypothetical protein
VLFSLHLVSAGLPPTHKETRNKKKTTGPPEGGTPNLKSEEAPGRLKAGLRTVLELSAYLQIIC